MLYRIADGADPIDPVSRLELVDPVLCDDGLIHDRWSVLISADSFGPRSNKPPLRIVGEVVQLKDAIQKMFPTRRDEYEHRRTAYRAAALELCGPKSHHELGKLLTHLSHCLLWDPHSMPLLVRRGVARYRVRNLTGALEDLTLAINLAKDLPSSSGLAPPELIDAWRFRALVRETCHDHVGAQNDLWALRGRSRHGDALALALSASLRASQGDLEGAEDDLAASTEALDTAASFQLSEILAENQDLVHTCRGWAFSSIGRFDEAVSSFDTALQTRFEPYALASRGLALIHTDDIETGILVLDEAIGWADSNADLTRPSATVMTPAEATEAEKRPAILFQLYFLRAMAYYREGKIADALQDFESGIDLRPPGVKDTGEFRFVLGCLRAELGDPAATIDFDYACALKPECRTDCAWRLYSRRVALTGATDQRERERFGY